MLHRFCSGIIPRARDYDTSPNFETKLPHLHVYTDWKGNTPKFRLITRTKKQGGSPHLFCYCHHINALLEWKPELTLSTSKSNMSKTTEGAATMSCTGLQVSCQQCITISTQLILMPFDAETQRAFDKDLPDALYLRYNENARYMHGKRYHPGDPVANGWRVGKNGKAIAYHRFKTNIVTVYYRPSTCGLGCEPKQQ